MVKHTQTIRRLLPTNYLSAPDRFVGLALKELSPFSPWRYFSIDALLSFINANPYENTGEGESLESFSLPRLSILSNFSF